jgi:hypothetical protein
MLSKTCKHDTGDEAPCHQLSAAGLKEATHVVLARCHVGEAGQDGGEGNGRSTRPITLPVGEDWDLFRVRELRRNIGAGLSFSIGYTVREERAMRKIAIIATLVIVDFRGAWYA